MGVDTQALLTSNPSPLDVLKWLENHNATKEVAMSWSGIDDFYWIDFQWKDEARRLAIHAFGDCKNDYKDIWPQDAALCTLGKWGSSVAIAAQLAEQFGGFYMPSDAVGDWVEITE